jgi:hypothetical protein
MVPWDPVAGRFAAHFRILSFSVPPRGIMLYT